MDYKLNKDEKLTSRTAIELLFGEGKSLMAFPLRAAYRLRPRGEHPVQTSSPFPRNASARPSGASRYGVVFVRPTV